MTSPTAVPRVAVLLSTFNGEKYLREQIDSLVSQESVDVELFVRDDGSTDNTVQILRSYANVWPRLEDLGSSENIRPAASFLNLLFAAPDDLDYYAFCDQDDLWLPEKLSLAVASLRDTDDAFPRLYCSLATCVDVDLHPLGQTVFRGSSAFEYTMFANAAAGNTLVMTHAAAMLVRSSPPGARVIMHDWWCALVVSAFGTVLCDPRQTLLYRQHQENVQGTAPGRIAGLLMQARAFLRDPKAFYPIHAQVAELLRLYGDKLPPAKREVAEALVRSRRSLAARLAYAAFAKIPRWDILGAIGTRALIAAGCY